MQTLKEGVVIDPWAVAVFEGRCNDADRIASQLRESCCRRGMQMPQAALVQREPANAMDYPPEQRVQRMFSAFSTLNPRPIFILVILPE